MNRKESNGQKTSPRPPRRRHAGSPARRPASCCASPRCRAGVFCNKAMMERFHGNPQAEVPKARRQDIHHLPDLWCSARTPTGRRVVSRRAKRQGVSGLCLHGAESALSIRRADLDSQLVTTQPITERLGLESTPGPKGQGMRRGKPAYRGKAATAGQSLPTVVAATVGVNHPSLNVAPCRFVFSHSPAAGVIPGKAAGLVLAACNAGVIYCSAAHWHRRGNRIPLRVVPTRKRWCSVARKRRRGPYRGHSYATRSAEHFSHSKGGDETCLTAATFNPRSGCSYAPGGVDSDTESQGGEAGKTVLSKERLTLSCLSRATTLKPRKDAHRHCKRLAVVPLVGKVWSRFKPGTGAFTGVEQLAARKAHNLEVAGSSPAPSTRVCDGGHPAIVSVAGRTLLLRVVRHAGPSRLLTERTARMSTETEETTGWVDLADRPPPERIPVLCLTESHGTMTGTRIGNCIHCGVPDVWQVVITHWKIASWNDTIDNEFDKLATLLVQAEDHARQHLPDLQTATRISRERRLLRYIRQAVEFVTKDLDKLLAERKNHG